MIAAVTVLFSALMALCIGFIVAPILVIALRSIHLAMRELGLRSTSQAAEVLVLNVPVPDQRVRFSIGSELILAAALSVAVVTIPVQQQPVIISING